MGNTCKPMAVSFQCMTKSTTIKKKRKKKRMGKIVYSDNDQKYRFPAWVVESTWQRNLSSLLPLCPSGEGKITSYLSLPTPLQ